MQKGTYKHFKGKLYKIYGISINTETEEELVLYKPLYEIPDLQKTYGETPFFVRSYENFFENVEYNGIKVERFKYVGNKKFGSI